jgi:hypothetical protein
MDQKLMIISWLFYCDDYDYDKDANYNWWLFGDT